MGNALAAIVGVVFVSTALIKALLPAGFRSHLGRLGVIPDRYLDGAVALIAAAEGALGVALVLSVFVSILFPTTVATLALLSAITWVSVQSGKADDCGCYGGFLTPSVTQSLLINAALGGLIVLAWMIGAPALVATRTATLAAVVSGTALAALTAWTTRYGRNHATPLIDVSPIKEGKSWKDRWSGGWGGDGATEFIVVYLGPDCPFCKMWIPVLNAIDASPVLPRVAGVVGGSSKDREEFSSRTGLRFISKSIPRIMLGRLVTAVPTVVVIKNGKIDDVWNGQISDRFIGRFKEAFFPASGV